MLAQQLDRRIKSRNENNNKQTAEEQRGAL